MRANAYNSDDSGRESVVSSDCRSSAYQCER
jgi:hypothetical protein